MDKSNQTPKQREMEIDIRDEIAQGSYANLAIISHSPTEFVLDFAVILPGMHKPKVTNRVIVTPEHAKRLLRSLEENVKRYESSYGTINTTQQAQQQQEILSSLTSNKIGEA